MAFCLLVTLFEMADIMFNIGEYVVYKHEVCIVKELKKGKNDKEYYCLVPISDNSLKINISIDSSNNNIKKLISKSYVLELIKKMPEIETLNVDTKLLESEYKKLFADDTHESLIKIIKTAYLRNKERIDSNRKISDKDDYYFQIAEKYLYNELPIVLGKTYEETKEYIIKEVEKNNYY